MSSGVPETWILYHCTHRSIADEGQPQWPPPTEECGAFEYVAPGFPAPSVCSSGHVLKMVSEGAYDMEVSA